MGKKKRDPYNVVSYENIVQNQEVIFREHFFGLKSKCEVRGEFSGYCVDYETFAAKTSDEKAKTSRKLTNFFDDSRRFDDVNNFKGGKCY